MKIHNSCLLNIIAIFLHFCESNAVIMNHNEHAANTHPPTRTITYQLRTFAVWETRDRTFVYQVRLQPIDFIASRLLNALPQDISIDYVDKSGAQFVVIKDSNGEFLGAEAGKISFNPPGTRPTYRFIYLGRRIGVWKNHSTGVAHEVRLLSANYVPFSSFSDHPYFKTHCFFTDGIWILVHEINNKVLGAQLFHEPCAT